MNEMVFWYRICADFVTSTASMVHKTTVTATAKLFAHCIHIFKEIIYRNIIYHFVGAHVAQQMCIGQKWSYKIVWYQNFVSVFFYHY